ncbi:sulfotransferase family protein [Aurantiacibacter odishensis]|uniref:sulfotransferase family protein n=1 Tax=Aurantiacibacter odishensis TaxID=1155476 RepID=UPI000E737194|nr:sulfotransferase family protein [Aurantiacibacter odishensis]
MTLEVIAAGLGRNATFSMKFALERLGFGPCHHMSEVFADGRRQVPLWIEASRGNPDWDAIFANFRSSSDYPSASYWRELAEYYPDARVVLTTRDPDDWFDSVSETIFSPRMMDSLKGSPVEVMMNGVIFDHFNGDITDRAFMTDWYVKRNREVVDTLPPERLLQFHPKMGWQPLCDFLGVEVPDVPFPRVNSRDELGAASDEMGGIPADPDEAERFGREYIQQLRAKAFG